MALKSDLRGAEYRLKAQRALDSAGGAGLDQVRLRHKAAALVWSDLAALEERRSASMRAAIERLALIKAAP